MRWFLEYGASTTVLELLLSHGAELDPQAWLNTISRRGQGGVRTGVLVEYIPT